MTDTSKETVELLSRVIKARKYRNSRHDIERAADMLRALSAKLEAVTAERDTLSARVKEIEAFIGKQYSGFDVDEAMTLFDVSDLSWPLAAGAEATPEDAIAKAVAEARNSALEAAAKICTGDEDRPTPISGSKLRRMPIEEQFAHEQKRLAWLDADAIRALKSQEAE